MYFVVLVRSLGPPKTRGGGGGEYSPNKVYGGVPLEMGDFFTQKIPKHGVWLCQKIPKHGV